VVELLEEKFGAVYKAENIKSDRAVALKFIGL
jgi:hypothetical protein